MYVHTCMHACMHACMLACIHTYAEDPYIAYVNIYVCIYIYVHMHVVISSNDHFRPDCE